MKKFEYRIEVLKMDEKYLNALGDDGWELVNFTEVIVNPNYNSDSSYTYIFKRELSESRK